MCLPPPTVRRNALTRVACACMLRVRVRVCVHQRAVLWLTSIVLVGAVIVRALPTFAPTPAPATPVVALCGVFGAGRTLHVTSALGRCRRYSLSLLLWCRLFSSLI